MDGWLEWTIIGAVAVLVLVTADRLLLAAERRGWICYRKKKRNPASVGSAFMSFHAIFEPSKQHVVEVRREKKRTRQSGDPDTPGDDGPRPPHAPA